VDEKGSLGLFLSKDKAVAVWTSSGADNPVTRKLNITSTGEEPAVVALEAARAVVRQGDTFDEAFVAVDCGCYTQYKLHSEFDDYHQVESTIKFDAEEAATTDAMNLAVAFDITGKAQIGSEVTVYTADRQLLTDMLLDMQEGALDPSFMEPDVVCLARALAHCGDFSGRIDTIFIVLSEPNCYMIRPGGDFAAEGRTFLIGAGQDVTGVLSRELMLAGGLSNAAQPVASVVLMGKTDNVDMELLAQRTGLNVQTAEPEKTIAGTSAEDEDIACHELLIAYGAALAGHTRGYKTDFRRDFMPYQGRRKIVQGSLRLIGISLTVLLVSVAGFFQLKAFRINRDTGKLKARMISDYKAVNYGSDPSTRRPILSSLTIVYKRAVDAEKGFSGDTVPAKLTFFFQALNETPKDVDVQVQQITITERSMKVQGNTNSHRGAMAFFDKIKQHKQISLASERITSEPTGRTRFDITIEPKKSEKRR